MRIPFLDSFNKKEIRWRFSNYQNCWWRKRVSEISNNTQQKCTTTKRKLTIRTTQVCIWCIIIIFLIKDISQTSNEIYLMVFIDTSYITKYRLLRRERTKIVSIMLCHYSQGQILNGEKTDVQRLSKQLCWCLSLRKA